MVFVKFNVRITDLTRFPHYCGPKQRNAHSAPCDRWAANQRKTRSTAGETYGARIGWQRLSYT
eukprot:364743-Chlamydomonas_euryale.AAC.79